MTCNIQKSTYDAVKDAFGLGYLDSFSFIPVHLGIDFSLNSKNNNLDYSEWKEMLLEFYFSNSIFTGEYCPELRNGELVFNTTTVYERNPNGEMNELWEIGDLVNALGQKLSNKVGFDLQEDDLLLSFTMNTSPASQQINERFRFVCFNPETNEEFDISKDSELESRVKAYVLKWANSICVFSAKPAHSFSVEISDSCLVAFNETFSEIIELDII